MHYEARVPCVINWYAEYYEINLEKKVAWRTNMAAWQYMQVIFYTIEINI
jgi:hypothetical protein